MSFSEYTIKSQEETMRFLGTSKEGLTKKEITLRQEKDGPNELKEKNISPFVILGRQARSSFFYLLLGAGLISLFIGERIDFYIIIGTLLINISIGFFQEFKAERAVMALRKFIPQSVKVLRQGKEQVIEKKEIVLGDVVLLEAGDSVPADLRIIVLDNFLVDESVLTGESIPVSKITEALDRSTEATFQAKNILFTGTSVISGKAEGIVIGIGKNTAIGQIADMVVNTRKVSTYEKSIVYFSRLVLRITLVTISLVFVANIILKGTSNIFNFTLFSIALVISILPEALPAVITFALSKGAIEMAKNHVVVRRLSAIEDLGNIEVLCTDKTGTLTENKLSLLKIVSSDKRKCLLYGLLSSDLNDHKESILNPFDLALFEKSPEDFWSEYKKYDLVYELPFDSYRMRSSYVIKNKKGDRFLITKGAPEVLLGLCSRISDTSDKKEIHEDSSREGGEGRRTLAIAFKKIQKDIISAKDEKGLTFLGYFVFEDPLKKSTQEAVKTAKSLGVKIKVITGDSKEVAGYVAHKMKLIGSAKEVVLAEDLEKMGPEEFDDACIDNQVFARISPRLKYRIVKSLQKKYDVGFLGEGINDAPALKAANVAIVVQSASDVSREVSDIVLLKKDLKAIVNGIKSGRQVYANINKYIKCTLASNFGNFYSVSTVSLFINFLPMLPVQILMVNLLSDFPLIAVAKDTVDVEELKKPKMYQLSSMLPFIISLALVSTVFDFIFFSMLFKLPPGQVQTLWFVASILTELLLIFIIRTIHPFWKAKKPAMTLLVLAIIDAVFIVVLPFLPIGQQIFRFEFPSIPHLIAILGLVLLYGIVAEITKLGYFRFFKKEKIELLSLQES